MSSGATDAPSGAAAPSWLDRISEQSAVRVVFLLFVAGAVSALALPPIGFFPAFFTFSLLLGLLDRTETRFAAFRAGWAFAFGYHVAGLYWISNALLVDGDHFAWAIPFAAAGLPAVLAIYGGLAALLYRMLRPNGWLKLPVLAASWTLAELLRGYIATGFPWNLPSSAWAFSDALMQPLAIFGAYGYSFFVLLFALAPYALLGRGGTKGLRAIGAVSLVLPVLFAGYGAWRLSDAPGLPSNGLVVRIVQGNVPQRDKWRADLLRAHLAKYASMTRATSAMVRPEGFEDMPPPGLVIWPETAVPYSLNREPEFSRALASLLPPGGVLMTGAPIREAAGPGEPDRSYNALVALDKSGRIVARHDKFHLVPFGEYVPFSDWLPLGPIVKKGSGFTPGKGPADLAVPGLPPVGALICYEIIFPGEVIDPDGPRPKMLVNVTNDAWFGVSSGPYQHLAAARMRAIEEGIPVFRAANTGVSAVVDSYGRVVASLPLDTTGSIDSPLPPTVAIVPLYARLRETLTIILIALSLVAAVFRTKN